MPLRAVAVKARPSARSCRLDGTACARNSGDQPDEARADTGKVYDQLDERLIAFIRRQKLFFVGAAPLSADGRVNLSPKGYDSLAVLDNKTLAWIDLGGSGVETLAHLK